MLQLSIKLIKVLHEASVLVLLLAALLLLLALFSFHPSDSGWNGVSLPITNNLTGLAGSWLADFLFSLAGVAAWLFVAALIYLAVQLFYRPWRQANWNPFIPSIRSLGFVLLFIATTAIAAGHSFAPQLPYGAGGILGESLAILAKPLLGDLGANLFFIGCFLAGLSLVTGWSWLAVIDEIGYFIVEQLQRVAKFFGGFSLADSPDMPVPSPMKSSFVSDSDSENKPALKPSFALEKKLAQDRLYAAALTFVFESHRASVSALQRHFELDYDTAAGLIERMEKKGLISSLQPNGQRRLLSSLSSTPSNTHKE